VTRVPQQTCRHHEDCPLQITTSTPPYKIQNQCTYRFTLSYSIYTDRYKVAMLTVKGLKAAPTFDGVNATGPRVSVAGGPTDDSRRPRACTQLQEHGKIKSKQPQTSVHQLCA
jgi:hypothetical protein